MPEPNNLSDDSLLRSEELDEIIGRPPHWLIRWGISLFLLFALLILALCWFIHYPEFIATPVQVVGDHPPAPVAMPQTGAVRRVLIKEGARVDKGDTLFTWTATGRQKEEAVLSPASGNVEFVAPVITSKIFPQFKVVIYISAVNYGFQLFSYVDAGQAAKIKIGSHAIIYLKDASGNQLPESYTADVTYVSSIAGNHRYYLKYNVTGPMQEKLLKQINKSGEVSAEAEILVSRERLLQKLLSKQKFRTGV